MDATVAFTAARNLIQTFAAFLWLKIANFIDLLQRLMITQRQRKKNFTHYRVIAFSLIFRP